MHTPTSLFIPAMAQPASPSRAAGSSTSPLSPQGQAERQLCRVGPSLAMAGAGPPASSPRPHQPQRLRSLPQDPLGCPSARSTGGELDRSRRNVLSLSARSVGSGGAGSSRMPVGFQPHGQQCERPARHSDGGVGEIEQDPLHDAVVRFCMQRPAGRYAMVRLTKGVYLYGNKKLVVAVHNDKLMARIGGGFVHLETYLLEADRGAPSVAVATSMGPARRPARLAA